MQNRLSGRRRHLVAAVAAVLSITAGTALAAGPAIAAGPAALAAAPAAPAAAAEDVNVPFPVDAGIAGAGATGFLTRNQGGELHWTRYADGVKTEVMYAAGGGVDRTGTDILVIGDSNAPDLMRSVTLRNMAVPGTPSVHFDLGSLWARYVEALGPDSVLAKRVGSNGTEKLLIVTDENGIARDREVTGLPADASGFFADAPVLDGKILVGYETGSSDLRTNARAVIDVTTGAVVETYPAGMSDTLLSLHDRLALSATHVAWTAFSESEGIVYTTVDRRTRATTRHTFPTTDEYFIGLAGHWLVYGSPSELTDNGTFPNTKIQAVDLTAGPTSEPVEIAAYANSLESAGDGTLLVRGGTVEQGEGLYKVSSSAGGELAVEKVATTEQPTKLTYLGSQVPAVIDFDRDRETELNWRMSRLNADVQLKLTHLRTGQTYTRELKLRREYPSQHTLDDTTFGITWQGVLDDLSKNGKSAFDGDYAWSFRAVPQNGIGPELKQAGAFRVVRTVKPHDYSDNGSPDLFARDGNGSLWRFDSTYNSYTRKLAPTYQRSAVGPGWNAYDRIESVGNVAGTNVADVIARDKTGVLWLYQGTGNETKPLGTRTKIGPGWGVYNHLAGGSDLTGDGKADLVATDKAGDLYLYKGTGSATAPFGARKKVGGGWGAYNQLTAVGNLAGGPAGDLLARDTAGVLWLYLGKGDGTFANRVRVGSGWGGFTELIGFGDANKDGRTDLYAWNKNGPSYFYAGTGNWSAPFAGRAQAELLTYAGGAYQHAL
ncbi:FG-GAP repeat domain-containing protein [Streptomyces sp. NPDC053253]|uniref:FG-GAP repeat domain-containing protein n=1 Tax=Streptomyces sp. NPDC053253 TaxID=3365699 RepID=UPI0037D638EE